MCFAVQNFFQLVVGRRLPIELFQDYAPSVATTGPKESVPIMVETAILVKLFRSSPALSAIQAVFLTKSLQTSSPHVHHSSYVHLDSPSSPVSQIYSHAKLSNMLAYSKFVFYTAKGWLEC